MLKRSLAFFGIAVFCFLTYLVFHFFQHQHAVQNDIIQKGHTIRSDLERHITEVLKSVEDKTYRYAQTLGQQLSASDSATLSLSKSALEAEIRALTMEMDTLSGVTVAFEPHVFPGDKRLYAPYFDKTQNRFIYIEEVYDYTDDSLATAQWYTQVRDEGARWVEPYFAQAAQALVTDFGAPIIDANNNLLGTVTLTITLQQFNDFIRTLTIGKTGEALILSGENAILAHTNESLVRERFTPSLLSVASNTLGEPFLAGQEGALSYEHATKQDKAYFFYGPLSHNPWKLGVLLFEQDQLSNGKTVKRLLVQISMVLCVLLFVLLAIFFNRDYLSTGEAWILSAFASLIFLGNTIFIGVLQHNAGYENEDETPVTSPAQVAELARENPLTAIPLGLQIEQMEFKSAYNLNVGGTLWFTIPQDEQNNFENLGVHFSQLSPFAESFVIDEVYQEETPEGLYKRFEFRATLLLKFDYSHFPFDKRHIAMGLVPVNPESRAYFVPDLSSYGSVNVSALPGLDKRVHLPGSVILGSYFSFIENRSPDPKSRANNIGMAIPELHFNIDIKRILINAFVSYLIPILVSLVMMFILLYATSKPPQKDNPGGGIVEGMAAFFFVLVFSHIDMRKSIETPELMYMEYFYFIAYFMVALTTTNLVLFTRSNVRLFDFKNNLVMKLAFWPLFLCLGFVLTLTKFY